VQQTISPLILLFGTVKEAGMAENFHLVRCATNNFSLLQNVSCGAFTPHRLCATASSAAVPHHTYCLTRTRLLSTHMMVGSDSDYAADSGTRPRASPSQFANARATQRSLSMAVRAPDAFPLITVTRVRLGTVQFFIHKYGRAPL
jgi:hypothetical protein